MSALRGKLKSRPGSERPSDTCLSHFITASVFPPPLTVDLLPPCCGLGRVGIVENISEQEEVTPLGWIHTYGEEKQPNLSSFDFLDGTVYLLPPRRRLFESREKWRNWEEGSCTCGEDGETSTGPFHSGWLGLHGGRLARGQAGPGGHPPVGELGTTITFLGCWLFLELLCGDFSSHLTSSVLNLPGPTQHD